ncbi:MAG: YidC/Oxa1 family membrane protein insertase [Candidatus Buchananbacteria bacterium]
MISELFFAVFYQPMFNLLVFFYNIIGKDLGLAIILITILLKIITYPLNSRALKSQKALQQIQPKINELKVKHKGDSTGLSQAIMGLYKEEKVNPASSCLPLLIQLPFLIAIYRVFSFGITKVDSLKDLYSFVHNPGILQNVSFGFLDLAQRNVVLAILAAAATFWQVKMLPQPKPANINGSKDEDMAAMMNKQMVYLMPAMTLFIAISLPAGLSLYWLVMTLLQVAQQWYVFKKQENTTTAVVK